MELVKIYSLEGQGLEVLYALQVAVSHLSHPPSKSVVRSFVLHPVGLLLLLGGRGGGGL